LPKRSFPFTGLHDVETLCYKPEGRGVDSSRTMALGSTQPLTEMSTRNLPGGKEQPVPKAVDLTICEPTV
jgi:hypothetical protein